MTKKQKKTRKINVNVGQVEKMTVMALFTIASFSLLLFFEMA
jgi:hypothetical protein